MAVVTPKILSWEDIKKRAYAFISEWNNADSEIAESQTFWNDFFLLFGRRRKEVARFERRAKRLSSNRIGRIDLLWSGVVAVEHKSRGADLATAENQLFDYDIPPSELPEIYVLSDFKRFRVIQSETNRATEFTLEELVDNITLFAPIAGYQTKPFVAEEEASIEAAELFGSLYDNLAATGYPQHALRVLVVRLLFCVFSDDTNIWRKNFFREFIEFRTSEDGSDLGAQLNFLFQILDEPEHQRQTTLDEDIASFPYINGGLFNEVIPISHFTRESRNILLKACQFRWSKVSPVIFGSLFQSVRDDDYRRQFGEHYTSEADILKVIDALFLGEIKNELRAIRGAGKQLDDLHTKIASIKILDPASGCGNFLAIAYRELRRTEREILVRKYSRNGVLQQITDISSLAKVNIGQFSGIELDEFPARIAQTAMYLVDHLENCELAVLFGQYFTRFPITEETNIRIANSLEVDWKDLAHTGDFDYILGNPPYGGHRYRSTEQSNELKSIWGKQYNKLLDYVTAWFYKAGEYARTRKTRVAFVATNSISQGEQVSHLWGHLLSKGLRIDFAYQTFNWTSEARGRAHVHVVIIGFSDPSSHLPSRRQKTIYSVDPLSELIVPQPALSISPYLVDGPEIVIDKRPMPISPVMPRIKYGSLPSDGGALIVSANEYQSVDTHAKKYLRRFLGSAELVNSIDRWCLWMPNGPDPKDVRSSPFLASRLDQVRRNRLKSTNPDTRKLADTPYRFFHVSAPSGRYIALPAQVSNSRRWYTPMYLNVDTIPSNTLYWADDPSGLLFAILSSEMFMSWLRGVGGKIKSDPRIGKSVYNSFPIGDLPESICDELSCAGQHLNSERTRLAGFSLADIYESNSVPLNIVKCHQKIDRIMSHALGFSPRESSHLLRLQFLLNRYSSLVGI
jgi:hypothetical protein